MIGARRCVGAVALAMAALVGCQPQISRRTVGTTATGTASPSAPTATPTPLSVTAGPSGPPRPRPSLSGPASGPIQAGLVVVGPSGAVFVPGSVPGRGPTERIAAGVVLPIEAVKDGWARVRTPCEQLGWVRLGDTAAISHPTVVLDPGHGGRETGAVGSEGLAEKDVNLDVARRAAQTLQAQGIDVVLTRTADYMATLAFRVTVAASVQPAAFVSIHHNAKPDGPRSAPGTETFYQHTSASSKRLAGLLYEETTAALAGNPADWVGNTDAGARWRLNAAGGDYYGILRYADAHRLTASIAEMLFISNPTEEALLLREDVRQAEAQAIARALVRFLSTSDLGSGFSIPHPRTEPAGGGGGQEGCVDPIQP